MISQTQIEDIETKQDQPDYKDIQIAELQSALSRIVGYFEKLFPLGNLGTSPELKITDISPEERTLSVNAIKDDWIVTKTFLIKDHGQNQVRHTSTVDTDEE